MNLLKLALATVALTAASTADASNSQIGTIGNINAQYGKIFFAHFGARSATPACSTQNYRYVFDVQSPDGQAKLSLLLTAVALHKQVYVFGTGACTDWGDTETMDYIIMVNE